MDVGCYCVSGSRLAAGAEPERVYGAAWYGPTGTDWVFTGLLRFPATCSRRFDCGTALPNRDELEVVGSEGSLFLDDPWHANDAGDRAARATAGRADRARARRTRTGSSSRTSTDATPARRSCCSAATTRSARHARSRRSTARRESGEPVSL